MSIFLWFAVIACALTYVPHLAVVAARFQLQRGYDTHQPREQSGELVGWGKRAWSAELNAFEALPIALCMAFIAHLCGADAWLGGLCCGTWVVGRLAHLGFYLADIPMARSASFGLANLALVGLLALSVWSDGWGL